MKQHAIINMIEKNEIEQRFRPHKIKKRRANENHSASFPTKINERNELYLN